MTSLPFEVVSAPTTVSSPTNEPPPMTQESFSEWMLKLPGLSQIYDVFISHRGGITKARAISLCSELGIMFTEAEFDEAVVIATQQCGLQVAVHTTEEHGPNLVHGRAHTDDMTVTGLDESKPSVMITWKMFLAIGIVLSELDSEEAQYKEHFNVHNTSDDSYIEFESMWRAIMTLTKPYPDEEARKIVKHAPVSEEEARLLFARVDPDETKRLVYGQFRPLCTNKPLPVVVPVPESETSELEGEDCVGENGDKAEEKNNDDEHANDDELVPA